jgi:hypothetical protein
MLSDWMEALFRCRGAFRGSESREKVAAPDACQVVHSAEQRAPLILSGYAQYQTTLGKDRYCHAGEDAL